MNIVVPLPTQKSDEDVCTAEVFVMHVGRQ
jgi:hypothetical protein